MSPNLSGARFPAASQCCRVVGVSGGPGEVHCYDIVPTLEWLPLKSSWNDKQELGRMSFSRFDERQICGECRPLERALRKWGLAKRGAEAPLYPVVVSSTRTQLYANGSSQRVFSAAGEAELHCAETHTPDKRVIISSRYRSPVSALARSNGSLLDSYTDFHLPVRARTVVWRLAAERTGARR